MFKFILKKLLFMIPMLLVISFLIFFALKSMPIDPINYLLPPEASQDATLKEQLREAYGLNKPFLVQYGNWIGNILKGDFGYSILNGQPIKEILKQKLPATLQLATTALVISSVLGILLGILSAVNQNSIIDYIGRVIGVLGQSIPQFLFGIILITVFALQLKILPAGGRNLYGKNDLLSQFKAIILPACALSIGMIATVLRYTRNSMLDVINKEYIKTARSKGVSEAVVYFKHAFRNSMGAHTCNNNVSYTGACRRFCCYRNCVQLAWNRFYTHGLCNFRRLSCYYGYYIIACGSNAYNKLLGRRIKCIT